MVVMGLASFASDLTMPISWDTCVEIGGPYTATVAAAMNMLGNLAGFVAPVIGGVILQRRRHGTAWVESADRYDGGRSGRFGCVLAVSSIRNRRSASGTNSERLHPARIRIRCH